MRTMYIEDRQPTNDRPTDLTFWKTSNGHISATGHPIHFVFGSIFYRVGWPPSWKISNGHISGMSYPIHFHDTEQLWRNTGENNAGGVIRLVTI